VEISLNSGFNYFIPPRRMPNRIDGAGGRESSDLAHGAWRVVLRLAKSLATKLVIHSHALSSRA
jgi:hypothetical protein